MKSFSRGCIYLQAARRIWQVILWFWWMLKKSMVLFVQLPEQERDLLHTAWTQTKRWYAVLFLYINKEAGILASWIVQIEFKLMDVTFFCWKWYRIFQFVLLHVSAEMTKLSVNLPKMSEKRRPTGGPSSFTGGHAGTKQQKLWTQ